MATFINLSAKDGTQQVIFVDKISNIYHDQEGNSVISLVNNTNIVVKFTIKEILEMISR